MQNWKTWFRRILTVVTAGTVVLLLVGWGTYALQFTTPTNDLQTVTLHEWISISFQYRIPPGTEQDHRLGLNYPYQSPSPGQANAIINESNIIGYIEYGLRTTTSSLWSYSVNYVVMDFRSNQSYQDINQPIYREKVWYTGPQGNLTSLLNGGAPRYYEVVSPANYTIHIFNPPPPEAYLNATGTVTLGASFVEYSHPYYNSGLLTIGAAGAFAAVFSGFTAYDFLKQKRIDSKNRVP